MYAWSLCHNIKQIGNTYEHIDKKRVLYDDIMISYYLLKYKSF